MSIYKLNANDSTKQTNKFKKNTDIIINSTNIGNSMIQNEKKNAFGYNGIFTVPYLILEKLRLRGTSLFVISFLLLQGCIRCNEPAAAINRVNRAASSHNEECVIVLNDMEIKKKIGSIWTSLSNPCILYSCELNENGVPHETTTGVDCKQIYCDVGSELRIKQGSCCGECVDIKCRYNNTIYDIGATWHNQENCMLFECVQLNSGQPMINTYKKTCPSLPPYCAPENIYTEDCCQFCQEEKIASQRNNLNNESDEDIWSEDFYRNHPCVRDCQSNESPKICRYKFVIEWYETLSKACYACPRNLTDCERPHCIVGDGITRAVMVVNRMMPGPSIEVCEGDTIVVDVKNHLLGETTTIHWHGIHQRLYPYMDGVPHISQCPITPHSSFRYYFVAENAGTHFWHSHTGMQRGDGVFGALIVRRAREKESHNHLYEFDLPEHKMILQDWVHKPGVAIFTSHHHSRGDNKPVNLLVNGRGRYYKAIWERSKRNFPSDEKIVDSDFSQRRFEYIANEQKEKGIIKKENAHEILQMQYIPSQDSNYNDSTSPRKQTLHSDAANNKNYDSIESNLTDSQYHLRHKRSEELEIPIHQIPLQIYKVRRGYRYRFRIINAEFLNCPIVVSIDNHTLTAIHSDGYDFVATDVGSIVTYAGERFDFILNANQLINNYWIRFKGLMDCSELFTSAFQVAILRYEGAADSEPDGQLGYQYTSKGIELNVMNQGSGHLDAMTVAELTALPHYDSVSGIGRGALKPEADHKFFLYYDFYAKNNPDFHPSKYYSLNDSLGNENKLYTPQINHISFRFPPIALLPARHEIDSSIFCNETSLAEQGIDCRKTFCKCYHVLQVELNSVVELIVVDEGFLYDANHPFHLHGNAFRVVGLERLGANVSIDMVKQLDRYNLLKRNLSRPPIKDTVTIPDGGYTIIRFEASNPGYWLFHCHIEFHAEIGMALIFKVGNNDEMQPVPKNFPSCSDYLPNEEDVEANDSSEITTTIATEKSSSISNQGRKLCLYCYFVFTYIIFMSFKDLM